MPISQVMSQVNVTASQLLRFSKTDTLFAIRNEESFEYRVRSIACLSGGTSEIGEVERDKSEPRLLGCANKYDTANSRLHTLVGIEFPETRPDGPEPSRSPNQITFQSPGLNLSACY